VSVSPEQAVDAANEAFGRHPGRRALHAKGTLLTGTFTATPQAAAITRAAHMQGQPVAALVRVSNGAGDPDRPDYAPDVRGLAVKLDLPDGGQTDIVAQTAPRFPFSTPDAFVEFVRAQGPGAAVAWRFPLYIARHPRMLGPLRVNLPALRPPASYATCNYYAIHAYRFLDAEGGSRHVRYTWVPEAGDSRLSPRAARSRGADYLQEEVRQRLAGRSIRFTLELQIAGPGDDVDDPASVWPGDRERIRAGTLEITEVVARDDADAALVFDPVRITDGIELSDDPVLRFRPKAYSESFSRRARARV
jgi:catalase